MNGHTQSSSTAEHAGAVIGRAWRRWQRQEHRLICWLVCKGVPATTAKTLLWIVKLAILGLLLYAASWVTMLLAFAVAAAWVARNAGGAGDSHQPEWRNGISGFGLYNQDGYRVDPHNFDDE